jgi:hypothetical protein
VSMQRGKFIVWGMQVGCGIDIKSTLWARKEL